MGTKLFDSFGAIYTLLERPRVARRAVAVLLVIHTFLLGYSAYVHSPTLNEPAHLVAGLSHWKFGRFELYRVNPPLVRMVAALPVMAVGYKEDWSGFYEGPGARPEMGMGENFVAANGERSFFLFMIARWACIPFSWIGAIVCFLWARDLYGRAAGVLAVTIWCFEPNILAHASLITPDAHATSLGLAACYTFWRWLKQPTWTQAALTGVVLGLAELAKTTLILFYPLWPLMWLIYRWSQQREARKVAVSLRETNPRVEREAYTLMTPRDWLREGGMLALRMVIGLYVLNLGYGFEGSLSQLKDFHFVSNLFTGKAPDLRASDTRHPIEDSPGRTPDTFPPNRFAGTRLGEFPSPFPKNYLLGIDIQQKDFERYGKPSYLRGEWRERGWWYYYMYALAIKVPLGLWLLGLAALVGRRFIFFPSKVRRLRGSHAGPARLLRDEFVLLFPAVVIFFVVSSKTGFSEHMRYVLPAFPYVFISISQIFQFGSSVPRNRAYSARSLRGRASLNTETGYMPFLSATFVASFIVWLISSSLWAYPHSLSYFNESIGGPRNGAKHLLGSNVDWGQDLRHYRWWRDEHPEIDSIRLVYYGGFRPRDVGINDSLPRSANSNLAISVREIRGFHRHMAHRSQDDRLFEALRDSSPHFTAGYTIEIYLPSRLRGSHVTFGQ